MEPIQHQGLEQINRTFNTIAAGTGIFNPFPLKNVTLFLLGISELEVCDVLNEFTSFLITEKKMMIRRALNTFMINSY